jgi:hypothetical protein
VRGPLPHSGAPTAVVQRRGAAERQRGELPKRGGNGGGGSFGARVSRVEAAAAAWGRGDRVRPLK